MILRHDCTLGSAAAAADIAGRITMGINHSRPGHSYVAALTNVVMDANMKPKLTSATKGIGKHSFCHFCVFLSVFRI